MIFILLGIKSKGLNEQGPLGAGPGPLCALESYTAATWLDSQLTWLACTHPEMSARVGHFAWTLLHFLTPTLFCLQTSTYPSRLTPNVPPLGSHNTMYFPLSLRMTGCTAWSLCTWVRGYVSEYTGTISDFLALTFDIHTYLCGEDTPEP